MIAHSTYDDEIPRFVASHLDLLWLLINVPFRDTRHKKTLYYKNRSLIIACSIPSLKCIIDKLATCKFSIFK